MLLTNLVNYAQPLIRYELTDAVTLAPNGDIASIDGRSDDTLLLPGENGKPVTVPPFRLRAPFTSLKDVRTYQLVHDGDSIDARVVLQPNAPQGTLARVRQALLATLAAAGAAVPLRVTAVAAIEREGHAAKVKLIKRVGPQAGG